MKKFIYVIFLLFSGLVIYAQSYDSGYNSNMFQQNSNFCTGGACRVDTLRNNNFINSETNSIQQFHPYSDSDNTKNRGGLNNSGNFTYDFNCQFGNCLPNPAGSYQP